MNSGHSALIRLIAFFKLLKAISLITLGFGILRLVHHNVAAQLEHWVLLMGFDPGGRMISHSIEKATHIPPHKIKELGIVGFIYAGLFSQKASDCG